MLPLVFQFKRFYARLTYPRISWLGYIIFYTPFLVNAQAGDSTLEKITLLRDDFIAKIHGLGFEPRLMAPSVVLDNPKSFGVYDPVTNTLHSSDWKTLSPKIKKIFESRAAQIGHGETGQRVFEEGIHRWVITHELAHWWRACLQKTSDHYSNEMAANRIATAFWLEQDPGYLDATRKRYQLYHNAIADPVPAGQDNKNYLNANYGSLPGSSAYTWYQAVMILDISKEKPPMSFLKALEQAGNPASDQRLK